MWSLYESGLFPQDLIHLTYGKALICLNPFENQVYFHSGPGKALCGAALRRYFREPPAVFRNQMLLMIDVFEFMMNEENGWKS